MALSLFNFSRLGKTLKSRRMGAAAMTVLIVAVLYKAYSGQLDFFGGASGFEFPELGGVRLPRYAPFTTSFLNSIWPLTVVAIILFVLVLRLGRTIANARRNSVAESTDKQSGSSAVEFVLILPPLVALLLMILQIALIVQAKFVVNYAAFCAARSAIVIIPDEFGGTRMGAPESRNEIASPKASQKIEIIQRAAALPLSAIAPLPGFSEARIGSVGLNLDLRENLGVPLTPFDVYPRSMMAQVVLRAPYSYDRQNTQVKVLTSQGDEGGTFKDHDWVTVKIRYRYYLAVPFAKKLFGFAYGGNIFWNLLFGSDYYYPIVEQYTLPMDGEPTGP